MALNADQIRKLLIKTHKSGLSKRQIALSEGYSKNTVFKYSRIANRSGLSLAELLELEDDSLLGIFQQYRGTTQGKRQPDLIYIHKQMGIKGVTLALLYMEYVEIDPKTAYSQSQFNNLYRSYTKVLSPTMRLSHPPGECVYVDHAGRKAYYKDVTTGKDVACEIFVAVLGCSKLIFAYAAHTQNIQDWVLVHKELYDYLGGVLEVEVTDNLKSSVKTPGKEWVLNPVNAELAAHYGYCVIPARVYRPKDKAIVERAVRQIYNWVLAALRHRYFFSLDELNAAIRERIDFLNRMPFKELPGCRLSAFEENEKLLLKPLPRTSFELGSLLAPRLVPKDYHLPVERHYYSVPCAYIQEKVVTKVFERRVEFYFKNRRIASHKRSFKKGLHTTDLNHMPPNHRQYAQQTKDDYLAWADGIGQYCVKLVELKYENLPEYSYVAREYCNRLKGFYKDMKPQSEFEWACQYAVHEGMTGLDNLKNIIRHKRYRLLDKIPEQLCIPLHDNTRDPAYYAKGGLA
ncbi:IS21 family transposase [Kangiella sp. TOML190]|uniref:IS21 family transposase n=1 Tax=Kangiella sp. TOML190 TaxID=2931351 RepID=UPI00204211DB|nr:IS21 family transposase [Kangiella sp. TOML190]